MKIEKVRPAEIKYTLYFCDTCKKEFRDTSYGKLKNCHLCGDEVCSKCAIMTEYDYLQNGSYSGDYPDYYCPKCWEKGKKIIQQIHDLRLARDSQEERLFEKWRKLCQKDNIVPG